ncbi:CLUMA_CG008048, isoform A [Clunio marinus]|uniref:CLUMA_CG008048, isoform A n=1 Tax=Clunio marinus TaxID=568069 RepID=A0A1J1I464_9DIPT|nr:CLUMA_CG008048, isoform A [Clunio marinus]
MRGSCWLGEVKINKSVTDSELVISKRCQNVWLALSVIDGHQDFVFYRCGDRLAVRTFNS